jgi:hypothetical protein
VTKDGSFSDWLETTLIVKVTDRITQSDSDSRSDLWSDSGDLSVSGEFSESLDRTISELFELSTYISDSDKHGYSDELSTSHWFSFSSNPSASRTFDPTQTPLFSVSDPASCSDALSMSRLMSGSDTPEVSDVASETDRISESDQISDSDALVQSETCFRASEMLTETEGHETTMNGIVSSWFTVTELFSQTGHFRPTLCFDSSQPFFPSIELAKALGFVEYSTPIWGYIASIMFLSSLILTGLAKLCYDRLNNALLAGEDGYFDEDDVDGEAEDIGEETISLDGEGEDEGDEDDSETGLA